MKTFIKITFLCLAIATASLTAQETNKRAITKQNDPKTAKKDTTKKSGGTRMAITNKGVSTKPKSGSANKTASESGDVKKDSKKEEPKKPQ